jgi:beta-glucosidase
MLAEYHHVAADKQEAARLGLLAGIDIELPSIDCYGQPLLDALAAGRIDPALVEVSARRVLSIKFQLGLFENPYVNEERAVEVFNTPAQLELSRELARQSLVLLKNERRLLPLSPALKSIAVIGPSADSVRLLQGDYHYPSHLESLFQHELSADAPAPSERAKDVPWAEHFPQSTTVLEGIRAAVSPQTQVNYAEGCDVTANDRSGFEAAVEAARQSEVAVVVVGDKCGLAKGCTSGESIDCATLILPGVQQALVEAIHATGTPTVVVLLTGRPYAIAWIAENVTAILQAWLPAQAGGSAIADILFGTAAPGGKLPISFPRHVGQVPVYYSHKPSGGRSHWQGNYTDMSTTPLYPFGHGLSYTEFTYSDLQVTPEQVGPAETVSISLTVKNTGALVGDEVVQLYVHDPVASVTRPVKELKGFKRLRLQPGESKRLTFDLDTRHLAFYDRAMQYVVEPGLIEVLIGSSSADIRLRQTFSVVGKTTPAQQVFFTEVRVS